MAVIALSGCDKNTEMSIAHLDLMVSHETTPLTGVIQDPTIAVDPERGVIYLTWVGEKRGLDELHTHAHQHLSDADDQYKSDDQNKAVWLAWSEDSGRTFSEPVRVSGTDPFAGEGFSVKSHSGAPPQVRVAPDGTVYVSWEVGAQHPDFKWGLSGIRLASSSDQGRTWSATRLPTHASPSRPGEGGFHNLHISTKGAVYVGYLATSHEQGREVAVVRSSDGGLGFAKPQVLTTSSCQCCRVEFTQLPGEELALAWRHIWWENNASIRDMALATSDNHGSIWSEPVKLSDDRWVHPQCPHSGPVLAANDEGGIHAAWFTGKDSGPGVYYAFSDNGGASFGDKVGLQVDSWYPHAELSMTMDAANKTWIAWHDEREQVPRIWVALVDKKGISVIPEAYAIGRYPRLAPVGDGVAMVWVDEGKARYAMFASP